MKFTDYKPNSYTQVLLQKSHLSNGLLWWEDVNTYTEYTFAAEDLHNKKSISPTEEFRIIKRTVNEELL